MRTIGVSLRPHDERNLRMVMDYLTTEGLNVGKATVSQAIRYALGLAAIACRGGASGASAGADAGYRDAVALLKPPFVRGSRSDDHA